MVHQGFQFHTLQSTKGVRHLGLRGDAPLGEMRLLLIDGRNLGGAEAVVEIARRIWWAWPLWLFSKVPGSRWFLYRVYRVIAANRHCVGGVCKVHRHYPARDLLPLVLLPAFAIAFRKMLPNWVFMWLLSFAIFYGCKWLSLRRATKHLSYGSSLAYLFAWPGMDAEAFLGGRLVAPPKMGLWLIAWVETMVGLFLVFLAVFHPFHRNPLLTGWLGMVGAVMTLHFGFFQLLSLAWRAAGRDAKPLMRAPLFATSLADFWGNRWNTAFNALANDLVFRKLARPLGVAWATLATFLVSGVVHDMVISLPACGGYGLPTAYFLLQGVAVLFERSRVGRTFGLGNGWRGRSFALVIVAAPVILLFHPPFVRNVILPMLQSIGGFSNLI